MLELPVRLTIQLTSFRLIAAATGFGTIQERYQLTQRESVAHCMEWILAFVRSLRNTAGGLRNAEILDIEGSERTYI